MHSFSNAKHKKCKTDVLTVQNVGLNNAKQNNAYCIIIKNAKCTNNCAKTLL